MSPSVRDRIEPVLGADLSHVRIHADASAHDSARALRARAFTHANHIWLGRGESAEDLSLIAHEATHVLQQSDVIRRQPVHPKDEKQQAAKKPTAADAPHLDFTPSKNGDPCACVVVVHNEEANARKTAQLMFENCAYNLALLNPDDAGREIHIPGTPGTVDPNSLFPRDVAERCLDDDKACRDLVTSKAGSTDKDEINQVVRTQFFLAIKDCSKGFSLPVVALHNNAVDETAEYRADKKSKSEFKQDVDKSKKETGEDVVNALKKALAKRFGKDAEKKMVETKGKTNIFRWCASQDLSKCHIGDPDHPDNITWVTNPKDFDNLSTKDINVALQTDTSKVAGSESEGDLSTLFLILRDLREGQIFDLQMDEEWGWLFSDDIEDWFDDESIPDTIDALQAKLNSLRYINIETPGKRLSDQTDDERARNYDAIVEVLKTAGLHCCGTDATIAEKKIKEGLKIPKPKPKPKPKKKAEK